ncbi:MAG: hypothetical protein MZV70_42570 [Desulfobacterales bacterium]|nr:hypothetical protein [Desulfobacterales bacterium]
MLVDRRHGDPTEPRRGSAGSRPRVTTTAGREEDVPSQGRFDVSQSGRWRASVALLSLGFALLFGPAGAGAAGPLTFFKNYFITGDYAVGGASLWQQGLGERQGGRADFGARRSRGRRHPGRATCACRRRKPFSGRASTTRSSTVPTSVRGPIRWRRRSTGTSPRRRAGPSRILAAAGWSHTAPTSCASCRSVPRTASRSMSGTARDSRCRIPAPRSVTLTRAAPRARAGLGRARSAPAWSWSTGTRRCPSRRSSSTTAAHKKTAFATMNQTIAGFYQASANPGSQDDAHRRRRTVGRVGEGAVRTAS